MSIILLPRAKRRDLTRARARVAARRLLTVCRLEKKPLSQNILRAFGASIFLCSLSPTFGRAQSTTAASPTSMHMSMSPGSPTSGMQLMMSGPLGLPMSRIGSGTSWLPDSAPMFGVMREIGGWGIMAHANVFFQYDKQGGIRGSSQLGSINWGMVGGSHALAGGRLQLRGMMSLEPFTVGSGGYPLLLQTGEVYRGAPIHDRQHPHDLFMELAAVYDRALSSDVAVQLYLAPVGEPAIGPVAFPHRPSAAGDPFASIGHHWQDATHVSFGVATAALYTKRVKLEGSLFNAREPDEIRTNFDYAGAKLDAFALRLSMNPDAFTAFSASAAHMPNAEASHPGEAVDRLTASLLRSRTSASGRSASFAFILGANRVGHGTLTPAATVELTHDVMNRTTVYLRGEFARKSADELVVGDHAFGTSGTPDPIYTVAATSVGLLRELASGSAGSLSVGARGTVNLVPESLRSAYGSRTPVGAVLFLRWRPGRMVMNSMAGMHDMK